MGNMVWMKLARGNRPQNNKMCQCAQPARRAARTLSPGEPRRITGRGSGLQNSSPPKDVSTCPDSSPQEALVRAKPHPSLQIDYDILLSPTYQVPVLYFGLRWHNHGPLGLEEVYQYVVPERYRQELKSVGVMGGISMGVGAFSEPRDKSSCLFCFFFLVVPSWIWRPDIFRPPMQHRGCHGEHCRRTERHSRVISPHLAWPRWSLREPARSTRAFCLAVPANNLAYAGNAGE